VGEGGGRGLGAEEAKQRIEQCYAKLRAGADFRSVATAFSLADSAPRGGDCGWFVRGPRHPDLEPLLAAAWRLGVGVFTVPIRGQCGWYIIKVTEREPAKLTYSGCRDAVKRMLCLRRVEAIVSDLRKKATIEESP
jgi:peptidyl-prolyl cis-trans isomerase C